MEYWIVTEDSLDEVAEKTNRDRRFFEREMQRINDYNCELVVFFHEGQWKQVSIDRKYNVDFVMKHHYGA